VCNAHRANITAAVSRASFSAAAATVAAATLFATNASASAPHRTAQIKQNLALPKEK